jgi:NAD(P)-dependent dehydrogenase (short-subunit alcohol dehydrogenase family)
MPRDAELRARRTVLTTGANSGLGLGTVVELARQGYRSVGGVRSEAKAEVVASAAREAGVTVETVILDVTDPEQCRKVIDDLRPYGLVNNAGYLRYAAVEEVSDEQARDQMETLVFGPMRLARLAIPHMRDHGSGRIVQVSSLAGRMSFPLMGWYQASKHALEAVSDALRIEVAGEGIAVVLVEPGAFKSGITDDLPNPDDAEDQRYAGAVGRLRTGLKLVERFWGDPSKVASVIAGAVSSGNPRARYVVGNDARMSVLTQPFTPTVVRDFAIRRMIGL